MDGELGIITGNMEEKERMENDLSPLLGNYDGILVGRGSICIDCIGRCYWSLCLCTVEELQLVNPIL
jgi:hypothetical protein